MTSGDPDRNGVTRVNAWLLCAFAAVTMAFGWGYRGAVGHEGGAMLPGAMVGMAICLASGRLDWQRRAAVAGLFTAVGFAWGGSISYMEHPKYVLSDSFPDVLYGYAMLFFLGGIWASMGGALLGMALTAPRSKLYGLVRPFSVLCSVYLLQFLYFQVYADQKTALDLYVALNWHDGEFTAALTALIVSGVYWLAVPRDRRATAFIFWCSVGWWVGYGGLTKLGGIELAPPGRSEAWGGVLGILVATLILLARDGNRAALLLSLYGLVGGGFAFALGVFLRHPVEIQAGIFRGADFLGPWKVAEESYGFFMGIALALGALKLLRGGIRPPEEDMPQKPLDVYAVFVLLIALMWMNLRRAPMAWLHRYQSIPDEPVMGMLPWLWYFIGACMFTFLALYALYLYRNDQLPIVPASTYGKGLIVFLFLIWMPAVAVFMQHFDDPQWEKRLVTDMSFWLTASAATFLALASSPSALRASVPVDANTDRRDVQWRAGFRFWACIAMAPVFLLAITGASMAMQYNVDEAGNKIAGPSPRDVYRLRFGPNAYWRLVDELVSEWRVIGLVSVPGDTIVIDENLPIQLLTFGSDNEVTVTRRDGTVEEGMHRWWPAGAWLQIRWFWLVDNHPDRAESDLVFKDRRLYFAWPVTPERMGEGERRQRGYTGYAYLERVSNSP